MFFDIDRLTQALVAEEPEEKLFVKYCRTYGLEPDLLHTNIIRKSDNVMFEITGLSKRGRCAWVICKKCEDENSNHTPLLVDI